MTVSSLHAALPSAPPTPNTAADGTASESGFAQALAQQQAGTSPAQPADTRTRPAGQGKPAAATSADQGAAADAATPAEPRDAADRADSATARDESDAASALAASMQLADFVRDLTTASRAVAARASGGAEEDPALAASRAGLPGLVDARLTTSRDQPGLHPGAERTSPLGPAPATAPPLRASLRVTQNGDGPATAHRFADAKADAAALPGQGAAQDADAPTESAESLSASTVQAGATLPAGALMPGLPAAGATAARPAGAGIAATVPTPSNATAGLRNVATASQPSPSDTTVLPEPAALIAELPPAASLVSTGAPQAPLAMPSMAPGLAAPAPGAGGGAMGVLPEPGVGAPLGTPQWGPALGRQMVLLGSAEGGTIRHAELRLDPPDLGPLRVSLNLSGDQATAVFVSAHPAVRAAVEAALPQLQQALADAGIQLGNTSVGDHSAWQQAQESGQGKGGSGTGGDDAGDGDAMATAEHVITRPAPRGLIDTFA